VVSVWVAVAVDDPDCVAVPVAMGVIVAVTLGGSVYVGKNV